MFVTHHCPSGMKTSWDMELTATHTTCPACNTTFVYTRKGWTYYSGLASFGAVTITEDRKN